MNGTNGTSRYPAELRERAIRLVWEHKGGYASEWAAIGSVAARLGMAEPGATRRWVGRGGGAGGGGGGGRGGGGGVWGGGGDSGEWGGANESERAGAALFPREPAPRPPKP